ncbi:MAG: rRNA maturation RNase YbeY [Betaproteobacteria bacterium RIFCSPLOWO2_02_FULL_65_24]|nr:MAG: rRNA maturation RNase YbeY [Betaproteobacteria bacterium RIFCSPLOWO2_02_FULL_65_24]OGA93817.1 MAG: rRNA maturation RNase YbeY [Betaproteobacteria bacterium RIFCSPLOWO2_12_FULL_66_14]
MNARKGSAIAVQVATRARVPRPARLRRWARAALAGAAEVTLRLVGEREGRLLNHDYRGGDHATNVLSFAYGRNGAVLRGDIVLCAPVIAREAREQRKGMEAHFAHLTVHGVLHLRGYRHRTRADARRMEARERAILRRLGYADPYNAGSGPEQEGKAETMHPRPR